MNTPQPPACLKDKTPPIQDLVELYGAVGWTIYSRDPDSLAQALDNSTFVASLWLQEKLIGLARCMSDDVSIFYLQDLLIHPDHQGQGHGRRLLERCLEKYAHVRQKVLLTDDEERQRRLYESCGFKNIHDLKKHKMNAYLQLTYCDLE